MGKALLELLEALLEWIPHSVLEESFELTSLLLDKVSCFLDNRTFALIIDAVLNRSTVRSPAYHRLRKQVLSLLVCAPVSRACQHAKFIVQYCTDTTVAAITRLSESVCHQWNRVKRRTDFVCLQDKLVFFVEYLCGLEEQCGGWSNGSWCTAIRQFIHTSPPHATSSSDDDNDADESRTNSHQESASDIQVAYILSKENVAHLKRLILQLILSREMVLRHVGMGILETVSSMAYVPVMMSQRETLLQLVVSILKVVFDALVVGHTRRAIDNRSGITLDGHLHVSLMHFVHTFMYNAVFCVSGDASSPTMYVGRAEWLRTVWPFAVHLVQSSWHNLSVLAIQNLCSWSKWIGALPKLSNIELSESRMCEELIHMVLETGLMLLQSRQWENRLGGIALLSSLFCSHGSPSTISDTSMGTEMLQRVLHPNEDPLYAMYKEVSSVLSRLRSHEWLSDVKSKARDLVDYLGVLKILTQHDMDSSCVEYESAMQRFTALSKVIGGVADQTAHTPMLTSKRSSHVLKRASKSHVGAVSATLSSMPSDLYNSSLEAFSGFHTTVDLSELRPQQNLKGVSDEGESTCSSSGEYDNDEYASESDDDDDDDDDGGTRGMEFLRFLRSQYRHKTVSTLHRRRIRHNGVRRQSAQAGRSKYHFRIQPAICDKERFERTLFEIRVEDVFAQAVDVLFRLLKDPQEDARFLDRDGSVITVANNYNFSESTQTPNDTTYEQLGVIDLDHGKQVDDREKDSDLTEVEKVFNDLEADVAAKSRVRGSSRPSTASLSRRRRGMFTFPSMSSSNSSSRSSGSDKYNDDTPTNNNTNNTAKNGEENGSVDGEKCGDGDDDDNRDEEDDDEKQDDEDDYDDDKNGELVVRIEDRYTDWRGVRHLRNHSNDSFEAADRESSVVLNERPHFLRRSSNEDVDESDGDWGSDSDGEPRPKLKRGSSAAKASPLFRRTRESWTRQNELHRTNSLPVRFSPKEVRELSEKARFFFLRHITSAQSRKEIPEWMLKFLRAPGSAFNNFNDQLWASLRDPTRKRNGTL